MQLLPLARFFFWRVTIDKTGHFLIALLFIYFFLLSFATDSGLGSTDDVFCSCGLPAVRLVLKT